jgi:hypothetical protein
MPPVIPPLKVAFQKLLFSAGPEEAGAAEYAGADEKKELNNRWLAIYYQQLNQ